MKRQMIIRADGVPFTLPTGEQHQTALMEMTQYAVITERKEVILQTEVFIDKQNALNKVASISYGLVAGENVSIHYAFGNKKGVQTHEADVRDLLIGSTIEGKFSDATYERNAIMKQAGLTTLLNILGLSGQWSNALHTLDTDTQELTAT